MSAIFESWRKPGDKFLVTLKRFFARRLVWPFHLSRKGHTSLQIVFTLWFLAGQIQEKSFFHEGSWWSVFGIWSRKHFPTFVLFKLDYYGEYDRNNSESFVFVTRPSYHRYMGYLGSCIINGIKFVDATVSLQKMRELL